MQLLPNVILKYYDFELNVTDMRYILANLSVSVAPKSWHNQRGHNHRVRDQQQLAPLSQTSGAAPGEVVIHHDVQADPLELVPSLRYFNHTHEELRLTCARQDDRIVELAQEVKELMRSRLHYMDRCDDLRHDLQVAQSDH